MNKCLNCGKPIPNIETGKRQRKFCDNRNKCKQEYHNKNKAKEPKYVQIETFLSAKEELKLAKLKIAELSKGGGLKGIRIDERQLTEIAENATKEVQQSEEFKNEVYKTNIPDETNQKRITQLEYELAHPPANFSSILAKKTYFFDRQKELKTLK